MLLLLDFYYIYLIILIIAKCTIKSFKLYFNFYIAINTTVFMDIIFLAKTLHKRTFHILPTQTVMTFTQEPVLYFFQRNENKILK